jgi:hypothetical protein
VPATFVLERKGNTFYPSWTVTGKTTNLKTVSVDWPATVKFGVGALNTGPTPYQFQFEGLKLIRK